MCPHHGAIQQDVFHIRVVSKVLIHLIPDIMIAPAGKTLVNRVPLPIFFGQKPPLRTAAGDPMHAFNKKGGNPVLFQRKHGCVFLGKGNLFPLVVS